MDASAPSRSEPPSQFHQAARSHQAARLLVGSMLEYLAFGPAFEAKLRVRAWAAGEHVVEVGRYLQSGGGKGWMRMELEVPIADGKGRWQQTCDGRLAWTREELAGEVRVRRVDVSRLRELLATTGQSSPYPLYANQATTLNLAAPSSSENDVPAWFLVGGLAEILDQIRSQFQLGLSKGHIEDRPMLIIKGSLRTEVRETLTAEAGGVFPDLVPQHVVIAVPEDSLSAPLPLRIEYWSRADGRLISMLEIYDSTLVEPPSIDKFRFQPGGGDFTNETAEYLTRFGFVLAEDSSDTK
ncbi:hypothetical protein SH139x_000500 [Planctomycetaceae bacterium SH139]